MTLSAGVPAIVVDASVAIEFLNDDPDWTQRWLAWAESGAMLLAPGHFAAELANALLRSRRLAASDAWARLDLLFASGVEIADRGLVGLREAIELADHHGLSVYDALYLQLALDVDGELATLDTDLRRAATAESVEIVG